MVEIIREGAAPARAVVSGRTVVMSRTRRVVWETPGLVLADQVKGLPGVLYVFERLDPDRYAVFVVLQGADESALDAVFDAERELYERFPAIPFDVRVLSHGERAGLEGLRSSSVVLLDRA